MKYIFKSLRFFMTLFTALAMAFAVFVAFILLTPQGASIILQRVAQSILGQGNLTYERLEGSLIRGVTVFNVDVSRPLVLSEECSVRVQELHMRLARFSIDGIETSVINARVIDPRADPVVVNGSLAGNLYNANLYAHSLDLAVLKQIIKKFRNPPPLDGSLRELDLFLSGTFKRPVLKGKFIVDHMHQNGFVLQNASVGCDLAFTRSGGLWGPYGKFYIHNGTIQGLQTVIRLSESRLLFSGDIYDPELNIHGSTVVGRMKIEIIVKGTRKDPRMRLVSDPQLPQEQLILMVTTGKRWDGLSSSMVNRKMTPELAGDFVDYFFFGGAGLHVAKFLGLSGITYKLDSTSQGVTLNKDISERLGVGYGVQVKSAAPERPREIVQTLESEYRISNTVTVGAQKEILPPAPVAGNTLLREIPDDRVFLKYKKQF